MLDVHHKYWILSNPYVTLQSGDKPTDHHRHEENSKTVNSHEKEKTSGGLFDLFQSEIAQSSSHP